MQQASRSCVIVAILPVCLVASAGDKNSSLQETAVSGGVPAIQVDVALVHILMTVIGPIGNPVSDLGRGDFQLFEDGVPQRIRHSSSQDTPVSIGIVFDSSGSMQVEVKQAREAVARLLRTAVEGNEYFLIAFNTRARMLTDVVRNPDEVLQKIRRIRAGAWTALLDATELGLRNDERRPQLSTSTGHFVGRRGQQEPPHGNGIA